MKALKVLAIILGAAAVLFALVLVLALTPSVQTWAVRKALASQPNTTAEIGRVAAGFSDADIGDIRLVRDGAVITAKGISANYSAWDFLLRQRVNVDQLTVRDLVVDLRNAQPEPSIATSGGAGSGAAADDAGSAKSSRPARTTGRPTASGDSTESTTPFNGLLNQAQLPYEVRIAKLDVKGRALLPAEQTANFELQGANIETGQRGKLDWRVDFADAKPASPLRALRTTGTAHLHIAADGRIDRVEIDSSARAEGPQLPTDQLNLTAKAEQPTAGGNENYTVDVGLERGGRVERIFGSAAQYQSAQHEFTGRWELALRSDQLAAMLAGFGLPELTANGAGSFTFQPDNGAAAANGDLQGTVAGLEKVSPELKQIGSMQFKTTFDGGVTDNRARLDRFQLEATTAEGRQLAHINTAQGIRFDLATKKVALTDPQAELARIAIQALPLAWAQPFVKELAIDSGDFSLVLAVEAEADGSRIRARSVEPLAIRSVTLRSGDQKLADQVTITARPQVDYSAARIVAELTDLNVSMPAGDSLTGKLSADVTNLQQTPVVAFASQLQAKVIAALRPYLPLDPGPLGVVVAAEGRLQGDVCHLTTAKATVNRENGALLTAFELQQPVTANLAQAKATVPQPAAAAARLRLGEVPLAWAEAFVANAKFVGALTGATMDISFRSADDITVTTTDPLTLRGVGATLDDKPMVQALDLAAEFTATKRGDAVTYEVRRLELNQGKIALAKLNASGEAQLKEKMTLVAKGNLDADVAALMNQPAAAGFATLSRGRLTTAFEASMGDSTQAKAVVSARNLVAREGNQPLGDLEMTLSANVRPDGSGTVTAPLTVSNANRKSDVAVEATFGKASDRKTFLFTGKITGDQVFVDDLQPLAALVPGGDKPTQPTTTATRDAEPFWQGVQGKLQVDFKRVVYGPTYTISPLRGAAMIVPSRVALDGLEGRFNGNPFKSNATITFNAQQPKPYALTGSADVTNFDVGALLKAANPNEKPALESTVDVVAKLNGNGGTIADLAKNVYGQFDLTGTQGVLRIFRRHGQAISTVSSIIGIIGAARGSDTTVAIAELARVLDELRFDTFKMHVERGADLNLKLTSIEFISPIMHTLGSGGIRNTGGPDAAIQNQPMQITFQLGAKSELAHLLNRVGLLSQNQDDKGYQLVSQTFTVGGTPAKPDSSSLWQMIGAAAARAAAGSFLR